MIKLRAAVGLVMLGMAIGAFLVWLLIVVLGVNPTGVQVGLLSFDLGTVTAKQETVQSGPMAPVTEPGPTQAPESAAPPTRIPPTYTPSPAPPTHTPTPIPPTFTPTPDPRLFWDDFETGIKPEWDISGDNFTVVDGMLISEGLLEAYVGDDTWTNYAVQLKILNRPGWKVILHRQDRDNYMMFRCYSTWGMYYECYWARVVQGQEQEVPGTLKGYGDSRIESTSATVRLEVEDGAYRVFWDGEPVISFFDTSVASGGFGLRLNGGLKLDDIQVVPLP